MRLAQAALVLALVGGPALAGTAEVQPGMDRSQVIAAMGEPRNRAFQGSTEALQYCKAPGLIANGITFTTIWLQDGKVFAMTTQRKKIGVSGSCRSAPAIDWNSAPKP